MSISVTPIQFKSFAKTDTTGKMDKNFSRQVIHSRPQEAKNVLIDMTYGKSLIHKNISFTGVSQLSSSGEKVIHSLSSRVNAAMTELNEESLILIGKNFNSAKKALLENVKQFPRVIKNYMFIESKDPSNSAAIFKSEIGVNEILNLDETPMIIFPKSSQKTNITQLPSGHLAYLNNDAKFFSGDDAVHITEEPVEDLIEILNNEIKMYDFRSYSRDSIARLNKTNIESLNPDGIQTNVKKIMLKDIGGQKEAVQTLQQEVLLPLKFPNIYGKIGNIGGSLFVGPPGNAKSTAAKALANEAGIPYFDVNPQLLEGELVGQSAKQIKQYYQMLRDNQPCIVFFDEGDAIFAKRTGKHKYADQSVNMHLDEIAKLKAEGAQVHIISATNHPELYDKAATRSGRFTTFVYFKNPETVEDFKEIFAIHAKKIKTKDFDQEAFAQKVIKEEMCGADIEALIQLAQVNFLKRKGYIDKMQKGTLEDKADFKFVLQNEDFDKALDSLVNKKKILAQMEETSKADRKQEVLDDLATRMEFQQGQMANPNEGRLRIKSLNDYHSKD